MERQLLRQPSADATTQDRRRREKTLSLDQAIALTVLVGVVAALIWGRVRADVVALVGAAVLLATGTVRPVEVQGAFASPALIALASLFVMAYAMELSGLLGALIQGGIRMCGRLGPP